MTTAVAYLAGCPAGSKNQHKTELLTKFIQGVNTAGDRGILHSGANLIDSDVAFIQGWQHVHGKSAPHLRVRQQVIDHQRRCKKRLLVVDSNLFNYQGKNSYSRYSFDGVFPTTGEYFWNQPDPARWQQISQHTGITLKDWRTTGNHILICTQRNGGWSMQGHDVVTWLEHTIQQIKQYTDRPIVIRPHPGDKSARQYLSRWQLSTSETLVDDLQNAWAVVNYNSTPAVAAAIEGVATFVTDPTPTTSQAYPVANTDLSTIENPKYPERQAWIERLAMCHWNLDEIANGTAWQHMKKFI
jgi:hypothetical protein